MTAPDRMCAPTSEPFSSTDDGNVLPASAASCFKRMAAARPAGPAPTMTTSNSIASLGGQLHRIARHLYLSSTSRFWSIRSLSAAASSEETPRGPEVDDGGKRDRVPDMTARDTRAQIAGQLLAWYEAMGVDTAVDDVPTDWLARGARAPGAGFALPSTNAEAAPAAAARAPLSPARPGAAPTAPRAPRQFIGAPPPPAASTEGRSALAATRALARAGGDPAPLRRLRPQGDGARTSAFIAAPSGRG